MAEHLFKNISALNKYKQMLINNALKAYGLGSGQYLFLINIHKNSGISQKELTALISVDKATTAKALLKLEREGYVIRGVNKDDRRYAQLFLSAKGKAFMPRLYAIIDNVLAAVIKDVDAVKFEELNHLLEIMISNAEQSIKEQTK